MWCVTPGVSHLEHVYGALQQNNGTPARSSNTATGRGVVSEFTTDRHVFYASNPHVWLVGAQHTAVAIMNGANSWEASACLLSFPFAATAWNDPWGALIIGRQGSTAEFIDFTGTSVGVMGAAVHTGTAISATDTNVMFVSRRNDANNSTLYRNHDFYSNDARDSAAVPGWTNKQPGVLGGESNTAAGFGGGMVATHTFAAVWNRPLTHSEIARLSVDPFCMLR